MLQYIAPHSFREHYGNQFVLIQRQNGPRSVPLGDAWMKWPGRRQYEEVVFAPGKALSPAVYNFGKASPSNRSPGFARSSAASCVTSSVEMTRINSSI